jgi:two-component system sensor histidine kinase BaeS
VLRFVIAASVLWITVGVVLGAVGRRTDGHGGGWSGPPSIAIAVIAAVGATVFAYRRLGRPISDLLAGADQVGRGDYDIRIQPSGPRAVRTLGHAFNTMATRLDESEQARQRFLADVTHELRTPLTVLQGEIEAQLDGVHPRDDDRLDTLLDQTKTLGRLVEDLRMLALSDAGELTLHPESMSLPAIVDDAVVAMTPVAARRGVTLISGAVTVQEIVLDGDPVRLGQVVTNLLTNAVRHTPPGGTVTVEVRRTVDAAVVDVVDTGPGIEGDPERLFDRFARAADSGGSGLGLTIARQLVEAHGGTLTATNQPGAGARFTVTVPAAPRV